MLEMSNYKSGPYSVACFWAAKAVMHYRDRRRTSWYEDGIETEEEFDLAVGERTKDSQLLRAMQDDQESPSAIRMISAVSRGPERLQIGSWILVRQGDVAIVACVAGMLQAQLMIDGAQRLVVRLWCTHCAQVAFSASSELWSDRAPAESASMA